MITSLAGSRIRYNKSRTILTAIAIMLTTTLLMALGTSAVGLRDFQTQQAASVSNIHATFNQLTAEQVSKLKNHVDVEALDTNEIFASVENGKMNGFLTYGEEMKSGIYYGVGALTEGRYAEETDEICGPKAFFERMGVEARVGNKVEISFRVQGKGQIQTREFVISGLVTERDISKLDISDSRIVYSATISKKLVDELIPENQHIYSASVRVYGESQLNYDEMCLKINDVAADIGCSENEVSINKDYLGTVTDPGTDTIRVVAAVALLIIVFSGIVIYSIYYVGVITDVQELGKLKALGASKKQIRRLLMKEGLFVSAMAIPAGLILGYLIPRIFLPIVLRKGMKISLVSFELGTVHMFSLPVLLAVVIVVLVTVYVSLLKPMRMAGRISPIEAIRYQESSGKGKLREGNLSVDVFRLSKANLMRNKHRTIATMVTMALSCVLFMSMAGALNSISAEDMADRELEGSDFKISLDYALTDEEYPENNLENISKNNPFSDELIGQIEDMDGVEEVRTLCRVSASSDNPAQLFKEEPRLTISVLTEDKAEEYGKEVKRGELDYDKLAAENGAVFTSDVFWEEYGLELGERIDFTVYDGDRQIPLSVTIEATVDDGSASMFLIPQEVYDSLKLENNSITDLYIKADADEYEEVKAAMETIAGSQESFDLYSRDEEISIGAMSVNLVKLPMYAILIMIALIGFMNVINTMVTSIVTRKRELGMLQAIGLTNRQLVRMLAGESMVFMAGTLISSLTVGNLLGYLVFMWAKDSGFMSVTAYHYPVWETLALALMLVIGQLAITLFIGKRLGKESLIERIRNS